MFFAKNFTSLFIYNFNKFKFILLYTDKLQILQTSNSLFALYNLLVYCIYYTDKQNFLWKRNRVFRQFNLLV
jgi:hypothetical protein